MSHFAGVRVLVGLWALGASVAYADTTQVEIKGAPAHKPIDVGLRAGGVSNTVRATADGAGRASTPLDFGNMSKAGPVTLTSRVEECPGEVALITFRDHRRESPQCRTECTCRDGEAFTIPLPSGGTRRVVVDYASGMTTVVDTPYTFDPFGLGPGAGAFGNVFVSAEFGSWRVGDLTMNGSTNDFRDTVNGGPINSAQNTESLARQNEVFDFRIQSSGPALSVNAGLGQVALGAYTKLSLGVVAALAHVEAAQKFDLLDSSASGFRTTEWNADGLLSYFCFVAWLAHASEEDVWGGFFTAGLGTAGLEGAQRTPSLEGQGVSVLRDEGRLELDTFDVAAGGYIQKGRVSLAAGLRRASVDVTLNGSGTLRTRIAQGELQREFSFENTFERASYQFFVQGNARVAKNVFARVSYGHGRGSRVLGVGLGYGFRR